MTRDRLATGLAVVLLSLGAVLAVVWARPLPADPTGLATLPAGVRAALIGRVQAGEIEPPVRVVEARHSRDGRTLYGITAWTKAAGGQYPVTIIAVHDPGTGDVAWLDRRGGAQ